MEINSPSTKRPRNTHGLATFEIVVQEETSGTAGSQLRKVPNGTHWYLGLLSSHEDTTCHSLYVTSNANFPGIVLLNTVEIIITSEEACRAP